MCYDDKASTQGPRDLYRWSEESYAALAAAGIRWQEVFEVLYEAWPRMRRHFGDRHAGVAGQLRDGRWLGVFLREEGDDDYLVIGARVLDADEIADLSTLFHWEGPMKERRFTDPTAQEIDWTRPEERQATMAVSRTVRMSPQTFARLHAEADRRGVGVTTLMRELIETGLAALDDDRPVTVRLADLHRAIDVAAMRRAA